MRPERVLLVHPLRGNLSMRRNAHTRPRRFTLVVLGLAVSVDSTLCEAKSKRIHVTA
jgi:hypothetical protein